MTDTTPIIERYDAAANKRRDACATLEQAAADYWSATNEMLSAELELGRTEVPGDAEAARYLVHYVSANPSAWSGGHTVHNMTEQMTREVALALLMRVLR